MEIETAYAGYLYGSGELPVNIDTKVPYRIKFTLEDLTDNYTVTPLDRLFRFAMEELDVPFLHAEAVLHRRYQNFPLPFELEFIAMNEEKSKMARYSRTLTKSAVFFDELDKLVEKYR